MDSQIVEFIYSGEKVDIYCSEKELISDIIQKFCIKAKVEKNEIYCICFGNTLDENITLENFKKVKNNIEKINILVFQKNSKEQEIINPMIKSSTIICPECKEIALIRFKNYKLAIGCKNNHDIKNIFLKDFEKSQEIDESKIICNNCNQKNKSNSFNKEFFMCLKCKKNLCPLCKSSHDRTHYIIKYEQKFYVCLEHEENYSSFCRQCNKN